MMFKKKDDAYAKVKDSTQLEGGALNDSGSDHDD
jgi:hypothetical protein